MFEKAIRRLAAEAMFMYLYLLLFVFGSLLSFSLFVLGHLSPLIGIVLFWDMALQHSPLISTSGSKKPSFPLHGIGFL